MWRNKQYYIIDKEDNFVLDLFQIDKTDNQDIYRDTDMAIIGVSLHLPLTDSLDDLYKIVSRKIECIGNISEERKKDIVDYLRSKGIEQISFPKAGYLRNIDLFAPEFFKITPYEAKLINPNQRIALMSMHEAIEDAGYGDGRLSDTKTGVFVGYVELDSYKYKEMILDNCSKDDIDVGAIGNLNSMIPARISYFLDLKGPCYLIDTACSSSLTALHQACRSIEAGDCEQAVVSASRINILPYEDGIHIGMESKEGCVRAFDDSAEGTIKGEGSISILIKPVKKALADKDYIYAVIKGSAVNQDGTTMGITAPNAEAQKAVIQEAWERSQINPEKLGCIEAHGTGTKIGDIIEVEGLTKAFSKYTQKRQFCALSSLKTNYGHLYDAAGLAGILKCLVQFRHHKILPETNFRIPNKKIKFENSALYVCNEEADWNIEGNTTGEKRLCAISSFGFSGTNCHMVLEEAPEMQSDLEHEEYHILTLSARNDELLMELVKRYQDYLSSNCCESLASICYSANMFRSQEKERIVFVFKKLDELKHMLSDIIIENKFVERLLCRYDLQKSISEQINLFLSGKKTDWSEIYGKSKYQKVPVPHTPLPLKRYWIETKDKKAAGDVTPAGVIPKHVEYINVSEELLKVVRDLLEMPEITSDENLLDIGADSILMVKLQKQIDAKYPGIITLSKMFVYPTISKMAKYICEQIESKDNIEENTNNELDPIQIFLMKDDDLAAVEAEEMEQNDDNENLTVEQLLEKINNL